MGIKSILLTVTALILSTSVNAAIITTSNSVIDDQTNLEWLNLNEIAYISYSSLLPQIIAGTYENYRVATYNELYDLVNSNGLLNSGYNVGNTLYDNWANIDPSQYNRSPFDIILSAPLAPSDTNNPSIIFINSSLYNTPGTSFYSNTTAYPDMAVALVREVSTVPVPAAVWLFSSGLVGLIRLAKSRKHKD